MFSYLLNVSYRCVRPESSYTVKFLCNSVISVLQSSGLIKKSGKLYMKTSQVNEHVIFLTWELDKKNIKKYI